MKTQLIQMASGIRSYIPGAKSPFSKETGGTNSARYCYSVWLRHLILSYENGMKEIPKIVAELGPGDSLGMGIAALLSGSQKYYAFDIYEFANQQRNLQIFNELVELFRNRAEIPSGDEFPEVKPKLNSYAFPDYILTNEVLERSLNDASINKIRNSIMNTQNAESILSYIAPWFDPKRLQKESIDMIFSQAVMEHVDDLQFTYNTLAQWLKPGAYMTHQIDFKSHGTADEWNGHWKYSDFIWKIIRGKHTYLLNRAPHSTHTKLLNDIGLKIVFELPVKMPNVLTKNNLAPRFQTMSEQDLTTSGVFILSKKPQ